MGNPLVRIAPTRPLAFSLAACALAAGLVPAACGSSVEEASPPELEAGFLRAAYAPEPPFAFVDSVGDVHGESPVALRGALDVLGVDSVRWIRMAFDELLPALEQGRVDVVASGLLPTAERRERFLFTRSTSCSGPALAVRPEASAPRSLREVATAGDVRLAVLRGSVEERAATALAIEPGNVLVVSDVGSGLDAVRQGFADALALTEPTLRYALPEGSELLVVPYEPPPSVAGMVSGCSALAVRRTSSDLARALDRGLGVYVGSDAHRALVEPLGFSVPDPVMRGAPSGDSP